ncbi:MAG: cyclic nucleotide-binding domain-containing protein [Burkholderiales bacterium]
MNSAASRPPRVTAEQLARLAPLDTLSADRLNELAAVATLERAARGADPLATHRPAAQSVFLLQGEMLLVYAKGGTMVVVGGTEDARHALNRREAPLVRTKAITDVELLVVDSDMLDVLATWDGVAAAATGGQESAAAIASAALRGGALAQLPAAHIDELMNRFVRLKVRRGDVVIREGDEGDSYYVVASGRFQVERTIGGVKVVLAELKPFDAFGEEALVSEAKRNATVVASVDAELLKLGKVDFDQLLREPLLHRLRFDEARARVDEGAIWLDVRYPSEYQYDKLPGAINVPLSEVRNMFALLDRSRDYVVYCQSGRRSAAAAFLFAQQGFQVWLLEGGLWGVEKRD